MYVLSFSGRLEEEKMDRSGLLSNNNDRKIPVMYFSLYSHASIGETSYSYIYGY